MLSTAIMIQTIFAAALLSSAAPPRVTGAEIFVCSRTMRFEDQYCAARTEGRRWGHREAAEAHEAEARYALPQRAAEAWLVARLNPRTP